MAGLQQAVDQAAIGPLDGDRHLIRWGVGAETTDETLEAGGGVVDAEAVDDATLRVDDAHGMLVGGPVDPSEHRSSSLLVWQHELGDEDCLPGGH